MRKLFNSVLISLLFLVAINTELSAQTDDNIIWVALKIQKKIDAKTSIAFTPILRLDDNISKYQNSSIDLSIKRKFAKDWSAKLLSRTWFLPDNVYRKFFFFDLGYVKKFKQFKVSSFVRMHFAFDIKDRDDPEYLRWKTTLSLLTFDKIQPFIAIDPYFRLNKANELQRVRYEAGLNLKFQKQISLLLGYRREERINLDPDKKVNVLLVTLSYTIPD